MLTRRFFSLILKELKADCVCDIGSRDGEDAMHFRHLLPDATVLAFEPNPSNYSAMAANDALKANLAIFPYALNSQHGISPFYVTDENADLDIIRERENIPDDESARRMLRGTSSMLKREGVRVKEVIHVETVRLDEFILDRYPSATRLGLWIDVEGAEYDVLQGMTRIQDRVMVVHVETARHPMRPGQKTTEELVRFMTTMGFVVAGSNIGRNDAWGDIVMLSHKCIRDLGPKLHVFKVADLIGALLKRYVPLVDKKLLSFMGR